MVRPLLVSAGLLVVGIVLYTIVLDSSYLSYVSVGTTAAADDYSHGLRSVARERVPEVRQKEIHQGAELGPSKAVPPSQAPPPPSASSSSPAVPSASGSSSRAPPAAALAAAPPVSSPIGAAAIALARQPKNLATFDPLPVGMSDGPLAPPEQPVPDACINVLGFRIKEDSRCYWTLANRTLQQAAADHHAPFCWGYSGRAAGSEPLVFHTLVLNRVAPQIPLMLWSFLATQCCDAVLWFWVAPEAAAQLARDGPPIDIPAHSAHRIVFKPLDMAAEWARIADDFPAANASTLAALNSFADIRFISDWARMVLMYAHGGIWADIDTVFLADFRPLFAYTPFAYRAGFGIDINNALMRLGKRPHAVTKDILTAALARCDPKPATIFETVGYKRAGEPWAFHYLAETLFDFIWLRFLGEETPEMRSAHPEIQGHWNGFFGEVPPGDDGELQRRRATPFLPGSYSYHWHNRYDKGLPPRSWAGILVERYAGMAKKKCVCQPQRASAPAEAAERLSGCTESIFPLDA